MQKQKTNRGFTIVELLIVIVVIAILAAISIVAYNGIQNRSHNTVNRQLASQLDKKIEIYKTITGNYPVLQPVGGVGANTYVAAPSDLANVLSSVPEATLGPDLTNKLASHGQTGDINAKPVGYSPCPYGDNGLSGGRIIYWQNPPGPNDIIFVGDGETCFAP